MAALCAAISDASPTDAILEAWLSTLHRDVARIFEQHSQAAADLAGVDIRRVARAWNALRAFSHPHNSKLRKAAGLPPVARRRKA